MSAKRRPAKKGRKPSAAPPTPVVSKGSRLPGILVVAALAVLAVVYLYLVSQSFWITPDGVARSTEKGYGDIPLHLTQVSKFAFGSWSLDEPIFYGARLAYPFLINLASGVLLRLTNAWRFSVLLPVWLAALAALILTYRVYLEILERRLMALMALLLFYLGGGLAVANRSGAAYPVQNTDYGAPMTFVLVHQRAFLLGLFLAGLLVLSIQRSQRTSGRSRTVWTIAAVLSYGILPLAHTHTFVAMTIVLGVWTLLALARKDQSRFRVQATALVAGGLIAAPQALFLLGGKVTAGVGSPGIGLRLGWMTEPGFGAATFPSGATPAMFSLAYLDFLWVNLGLLLPAFVLALVVVGRSHLLERRAGEGTAPTNASGESGSGTLLAWGLASLAVFVTVMVVRFQPWDYDDNKILLYWHWLAAPLIVWAIAKVLASRPRAGTAAVVALVMVTSWFGVQDVAGRLVMAPEDLTPIFTADAFTVADTVRALPAGDLVVTGDTHLNPVDALAGRPVYSGYPGWLWTRGLDYGERDAQLKAFYADPARAARPLLARFPARYALVDSAVQEEWGADVPAFDRLYPLVLTAGPYRLYRLAPK